MATSRLRNSAPVLALGVLAAAVGLTGVGIAASGVADSSRPASLVAVGPVVPPSPPAFLTPQSATPQATTNSTTDATPTGAPTAVAPSTAVPGSIAASPAAGSGSAAASDAAPTNTVSARASAPTSATPRATPKPTAKRSAQASAKPTSSHTAPGAAAPAPAPASTNAGAVPGDYAETSSGTITINGSSMPANGTPTLTVGPAAGTAQTQTTKDGNSSEVEKLVFGSKEVDAAELSITSEVIDADFVLSPQEPLVELSPGATWAWKADSTDGKEHVSVTGSYAGTETVVVGGVSETAAIVKNTLVVTGSIATTITETDDYDPIYRLILRDHQIIKGTYAIYAYTFDNTTSLDSLKPS